MANITLLEKLYKVAENHRAMKKWSERSKRGSDNRNPQTRYPYFSQLVRKIRIILKLVSGGDLVCMLKGKLFNIKFEILIYAD